MRKPAGSTDVGIDVPPQLNMNWLGPFESTMIFVDQSAQRGNAKCLTVGEVLGQSWFRVSRGGPQCGRSPVYCDLLSQDSLEVPFAKDEDVI